MIPKEQIFLGRKIMRNGFALLASNKAIKRDIKYQIRPQKCHTLVSSNKYVMTKAISFISFWFCNLHLFLVNAESGNLENENKKEDIINELI